MAMRKVVEILVGYAGDGTSANASTNSTIAVYLFF